jgi:hypothetical protein
MMKWVFVLLALFILLILGFWLMGECAYTAGMGASYQTCDCLGLEWVVADRTAADGPRKTICIGIIRSYDCYQTLYGPKIECRED